MKRTIVWPPKIEAGGLALTADPSKVDAEDRGEALRQAIRLSLLSGTSTNPFNEREIGTPDGTFQPEVNAAALRARIEQRFARLERDRRARLIELEVPPVRDGVRRIRVLYEDLELGRRLDLELSLAS